MILVALAGGLGAAVRFLVDTGVQRRARTVTGLGTLVVNTSACLLIGLLTGWAAGRVESDVVTVLGVGFLGGYSTFSTASVEAARMLLDGRGRAAVLHAGGMLVLGLGAGWMGIVAGTLLGG